MPIAYIRFPRKIVSNKKRKKLRTYIVTYEPDDCYNYVTVKASSPERAKKIVMEREGLEEFQIENITFIKKRKKRRR